MARPLRLEFAGAVYHITARGNARQKIFLDTRDYERFLSYVGREVERQGWQCDSYCLMPNHYHFILETPNANLVRGMQRLNAVYTQWFNNRHERVGHLLQGRYKSIIVERESHFLELLRYVVLNPVRAGLVDHPAEWPWSSYRATAGIARSPAWLGVPRVLRQFGQRRRQAGANFQRFVAEGIGATNPLKAVRGQIWLGGEAFLEKMAALLDGRTLQEVPKAQLRPSGATRDKVVRVVAREYGIDPDVVLFGTNRPAFHAAVYLLRREANLKLAEVAALCGISPSRVSQIQNMLERQGLGPQLQGMLTRCKF